MDNLPIIITTGDPDGIGKEVVDKALKDDDIKRLSDFIIIEPKDDTGLDAVKKAILMLNAHKARALVTAPVNKYKINASGTFFKGHTEYLAQETDSKRFAMMFVSSRLKVTIATRHVALKDVPKLIKKKGIIEDAILLTNDSLKRDFNIKHPKIAVAGLNPHAGENGLIGREEIDIIAPIIEHLKPVVPGLQGPISGDVIFNLAYNGFIDAVVSMYHDQALAPFKMVSFDTGVNVTLGLPFVRTSPDHGTANDIVGKNMGNPSSMKEAIKLAVYMSNRAHA